MRITLGICIAYDWQLLEYSLPVIYPFVDQVCLSLDKTLTSWSGNKFEVDRVSLKSLIALIDTDNKILLLEESFYERGKLPIENESFQRKRMAEALGRADWTIQIDTDEIFINALDFINELKKYYGLKRPVNIHGMWFNLIKHTPKGYIYSVLKTPPLATNVPCYEYGRTNGYFNIHTNTFLAHLTWARPVDEIKLKMLNWGHSHEFNGESFFKIWEALDDYNWKYIKDFHHVIQTSIPKVFFQEARNLEEFTKAISVKQHSLTKKDLLLNNIWISRLKKVLKKIAR
jgi:hypothetical protein